MYLILVSHISKLFIAGGWLGEMNKDGAERNQCFYQWITTCEDLLSWYKREFSHTCNTCIIHQKATSIRNDEDTEQKLVELTC